MTEIEIKKIHDVVEVLDAKGVIQWACDNFGVEKLTCASSLSIEDQVLTDMVRSVNTNVSIFTLDTGRLPAETKELMSLSKDHNNFSFDILHPDSEALDAMVKEHGENLFYASVEKRKMCCDIRKVQPLKKKIKNYDAWICGLRREQSAIRSAVQKVEWDSGNNIVKINPLADWSLDQVWEYIKDHDIKYNLLYDQNYVSIWLCSMYTCY